MTDRELKKLKKADLMALLLDQSREIDRLSARVEELEKKLNSKMLIMKQAGSMADEAMKLNRVFEAAQAAADQYLMNLKAISDRAARMNAKAKQEEVRRDSNADVSRKNEQSAERTKVE